MAALCLPLATHAARTPKDTKEGKEAKPSAEAKDSSRYGMFVFSDLCTDENGDIRGQRIVWMRYAEGDMLTFEYARGSLEWPRFAGRTQWDEKTRTLRFIAQNDDDPPRIVTGTLSSSGNSLLLDGDASTAYANPRRVFLLKDFGKAWGQCTANKDAP